MEFSPGNMEKLVDLLRVPEPDVIQGEDLISSGCEITSTRGKLPNNENDKSAPRTIEEFEEQEAKEAEELGRVGAGLDGRRAPEYTMNYRQAVSAEDVFLQSIFINNRYEKQQSDISQQRAKMEFSPGNMEKLVDLLRVPEPDVIQGEDLISSGCEITSTRGKLPNNENDKSAPRTIEEFEEQEAKEAEELGRVGAGLDGRRAPEYTMNYRQAVSAEDVFLQIGPKTPGSSSCENLVVRIKMPGDKKENIDLAVDTSSVAVDSSQYSLKLPLPHDIDPDLSKANWDSAEETLILMLMLKREFDYVNF